ncbi:hypothetical protein ACFPM3_02220 [Streptomyces coeruleoprunus]|uniref:Uncharacterized protein n=1 Tax=Streptomyces coeruleoprunus TaxID=285563 RepID=A0ABV9X7C4_9ACTN
MQRAELVEVHPWGAFDGDDVVSRWLDDPVPVTQSFLDGWGVPVDLREWPHDETVAGLYLLAFLVACVVISTVPDMVRAVCRPRFWHEGRALPLIQFVLFLVAYAFYSGGQTRSAAEAAGELLTGRLAQVAPLAILTHWVLVCLLWLWFGRLMGLSRRRLFAPLVELWMLPLSLVFVLMFTVAWMQVAVRGSALGPEAGAVLLVAVAAVQAYLAYAMENAAAVRDGSRPATAMGRVLGFAPPRPYASRWRVPLKGLLAGTAGLLLVQGLLAALISLPFWAGAFPVPSLRSVLHVELVLYSILLLIWCFAFRELVFEQPGVPAALPRFIDFSLALGACAIAATGLKHSTVTLGTAPPWLVALGPPLLVALVVFCLCLVTAVRRTPRWGTCLGVAVLAGVLVLPARPLLEAALGPVVGFMPLPDW